MNFEQNSYCPNMIKLAESSKIVNCRIKQKELRENYSSFLHARELFSGITECNKEECPLNTTNNY